LVLMARSDIAAAACDAWRAQVWSFAPNVNKTPSGKLIFPVVPPVKA